MMRAHEPPSPPVSPATRRLRAIASQQCTVATAGQEQQPDKTVTYPEVLLEVRGQVATIKLNNPRQLNGISDGMLNSMHKAIQVVEDPDSGIRCLVITGAGRGFCSGANLTAGDTPPACSLGSAQASAG